MKKHDKIYYIDKNGDHWPGIVVSVKRMIKVRVNHAAGNRVIWANESNIEKQKHWTECL